MFVNASRAALGVAVSAWFFAGCLGQLGVDGGGSGGTGGDAGAGAQGGGGQGGAAGQAAGGAPACFVELCDTPEIEGCGASSCAPPQWTRRFGDPSPQYAHAASMDGQGRLLLAGAYAGALDFGGAGFPAQGTGATEAYVAAFNADGTAAWAQNVVVG